MFNDILITIERKTSSKGETFALLFSYLTLFYITQLYNKKQILRPLETYLILENLPTVWGVRIGHRFAIPGMNAAIVDILK